MSIGKIIIILIGVILIVPGTICIFDARKLAKNFFSFGDQNEGTLGIKIVGFIIFLIGAGIIIMV